MAVSATRILWLFIGTILLVVPFLPLKPRSGLDAGPVWWPHVQAWMVGILTVVIVGGVAGRIIAVRKRYRWPGIVISPALALIACVAFLFGAATFAMTHVFSSNPHLVDEIAQLFQARIYAAGQLAAPIPELPEFFLFLNSFMAPHGWVSQYPPGHPALLALGVLLGLEWIVNPLLAGASAYLVFRLARQLFGPKTGLIASFLWASSGWVIFMSGTYQSHVSAVTFALLAWVTVLGRRRVTVARGLLCGVAIGALGAIRPLDAVAASLPIVVWLLTNRQWRVMPWIVSGATPFVLIVCYVNWKTFGNPITFGYTALYGAAHGLGFHTDPYGWAFTPRDALRNAFFALRRVHIYLFEWPIPAALPIGLWALLGRQRRQNELIVAVGILALPICYFFYWHSGFYIGPRFYYGATPFLAIGTARAWKWAVHGVRKWNTRWFRADMAFRWSVLAILMWGFIGLLPARSRSYQHQLRTAKLHPERELEQQGVQRAVVLIPGSWFSRTVARLWAVGAPAGTVERAIGILDTCDLDGLARAARQRRMSPEAVTDSLESMLANAVGAVPRVLDAPDPSTRLRGIQNLPERCLIELMRDYDGFTLYGQFAWHNPIALDHGVVFARDLFEENDRLLNKYQGWDVWRYAPPPGNPQGQPILTRIRTGQSTGLAEE